MICRSNIAKIVPIGNPRWSENLFFSSSPKLKKPVDIGLTYKSKKSYNLSDLKSKMAAILKICFLSPESKGLLTLNLVESIGVTCRSKIAKIIPIGNPRWPPSCFIYTYMGKTFINLFV